MITGVKGIVVKGNSAFVMVNGRERCLNGLRLWADFGWPSGSLWQVSDGSPIGLRQASMQVHSWYSRLSLVQQANERSSQLHHGELHFAEASSLR